MSNPSINRNKYKINVDQWNTLLTTVHDGNIICFASSALPLKDVRAATVKRMV